MYQHSPDRKTGNAAAAGSLMRSPGGRQRSESASAMIPAAKGSILQKKLTVNQPGDVYEQEADRMAEKVMRMPQSKVQRHCSDCEEPEQNEEVMRTSSEPDTGGFEAPPIVGDVIGSAGSPLDPDARTFMESRFGHDFSQVRVHDDARAAESARAVNAEAYTVGNNLVFGAGRYAPSSSGGRHLLAHELTHVIQQGAAARTSGTMQTLARQTVKKPSADEGGAGAGGVPQEVIDHLKLREGWRTTVYMDTRKFLTVGMGHKLTRSELQKYSEGDTVPKATLDAWAQADAKVAYDAAVSQAAMAGITDQNLINALAAVNFQLGTSWYTEHKKTWAHIMGHRWEEAAREVSDSAWYSQTPVRVKDFQAALRSMTGAPVQTPVSDAYPFKIGAPTGTGSVTASSLNVRKGPATTFGTNGASLQQGTVVTLYGLVDGWYCIGNARWVAARYISLAASQKSGPDLKSIVTNVHDAMAGAGTDEEKVYSNLARLNHDQNLIGQFKSLYQKTYGSDVVDDIKADFSNTLLFGDELTKALGYLNAPKTGQGQGGKEAKKLAPVAPVRKSGGGRRKSGGSWVAEFPTSRSTADLKEPFKSNVDRFIAALKAAGASVSISATYRPPERAYLMHWSYMIVRHSTDPKTIPPMAGVDIDWDHGDMPSTIAAAREMTTGYEVNTNKKVAPSLSSNHTRHNAIDMTISWSGTLSIADANGHTVAIKTSPRSGLNSQLIAVGATYKVIHYYIPSDDPPHWSPTGH